MKIILLLVLLQLTLQIDHCYIEQNICKTCKEGYSLVDGQCLQIKNCIYESNGYCNQCTKGYRPSDDHRSCVEIGEDHCLSYSTSGDGSTRTCNQCTPEYKLKSGDNTCELVVDHCQNSYDENGNLKCNYCEKGYALNRESNQCIEFPGCEEVDNTGKCIECGNDYIMPNKEGKCVMDFCEEYDDEWNCEGCEKYFYLDDKDKQCHYIEIPFCKEVKDDNKNECDDYAGFLGNNPEDIEAKKKEYETHCEEKNEEDGTCTRCDYGYELDTEKKCVLIGCKEYEKPSTKCKYCEHGYILVEDDTKCLAVSEALGESGESGNSGKLPNINYRLNILFLILLFLL